MDDSGSIAERKAALSGLLSFYAPLLTETQENMTRLFADEDCSFTEIGEVCGVSRQSAFDTVSKAERQMAAYEDRLHLMAAFRVQEDAINRCIRLSDPDSSVSPGEALSRIRQILQALLDKEDQ